MGANGVGALRLNCETLRECLDLPFGGGGNARSAGRISELPCAAPWPTRLLSVLEEGPSDPLPLAEGRALSLPFSCSSPIRKPFLPISQVGQEPISCRLMAGQRARS